MGRREYWNEIVADALLDAGVQATKEQIEQIAGSVEGAHENMGLAFHVPENPLAGELRDTRAKLKVEQSKVGCKECNGTGTTTTYGPYHSATSTCWKCRGEGKHVPK